jgi:F-type H+-transporting ATPase subunit epsilon
MGVLPQHAPMIVLLQEGVIRLYEGSRVTESLRVSGGFAEVTPTRVTVLADTVTPV